MAMSWTSFLLMNDLLSIQATSWSLAINFENCKHPAHNCAAILTMAQLAWLSCVEDLEGEVSRETLVRLLGKQCCGLPLRAYKKRCVSLPKINGERFDLERDASYVGERAWQWHGLCRWSLHAHKGGFSQICRIDSRSLSCEVCQATTVLTARVVHIKAG